MIHGGENRGRYKDLRGGNVHSVVDGHIFLGSSWQLGKPCVAIIHTYVCTIHISKRGPAKLLG